MGIQQIVNVSVSVASAPLVAQGFGTPGLFGLENHFSDRFRYYSSPSAMLGDGFLTSDDAYKMAQSLFAQKRQPAQFLYGRRLAEVAQQDTITFSADHNGDTYQATVNGVLCSFTSVGGGTTADATGLAAAIQAQSSTTGVTASGTGPVVTLVASVAGNPFSCVLGGTGIADMALAVSVPNQGAAEDLGAVKTAGGLWYGTGFTSRLTKDILNAAAWIESNSSDTPYIYLPQSSDSASLTAAPDKTVTSDLANKLFGLGYNRTGLMWHGIDTEFAEAALMGLELPTDPGTDNWANKILAGITPNSLSQTAMFNLFGTGAGAGATFGKNANAYAALTPQLALTQRGRMASGQWIDVIRFADFLNAQIATALVNRMIQQEKIPYDDTGIGQAVFDIAGVLQAAENAKKLESNPKYSIVAPAAADIAKVDKQNRTLNPPIEWSAELSGALNGITVKGTVTL